MASVVARELQIPMNATSFAINFQGKVECTRDDSSPLGLTLVGRSLESPAELITLAFVVRAPADLPDTLEQARVEKLFDRCYRISGASREWLISASAVHLHREVTGLYHTAVAARAAPWSKRLFWRIVLALAATRSGKRLLLALRRG
jgi:hypothetical protein